MVTIFKLYLCFIDINILSFVNILFWVSGIIYIKLNYFISIS